MSTQVELQTTAGTIRVELDEEKAPRRGGKKEA